MRFLKKHYLLLLLTFAGVILHFYNLNWGAPFYFHPDERNIASSVSQLQFPSQMNPHFFAYGSLPIYLIYLSGVLINLITNHQSLITSFEQAIQISRFYSALFSTLLIPLLFLIGKKLTLLSHPEFISGSHEIPKQVRNDKMSESVGLLTAVLATTSVGFIQFAHFGTFEMWLTFFSVLLFWICLEKHTKKNLLLMGVIFGILIATKISSLALLPLPLLALIFQNNWKNQTIKLSKNLKFKLPDMVSLLSFLKNVIFILLVSFLVYFLTNPFVFFDTKSFLDSMNYETSLAVGNLPVFYTGEFFKTIPIVFQFKSIYPFLINPLITIIFIPAFIYLIYKTIKTRNRSYIILITFYIILFFSQAFLFAKWTRYMMPTLPFIFLIMGIAVTDFLKKKQQHFNSAIMLVIISINFLFASSYFITAFVRPDTRVAAYQAAQKTIPFDASILSEVYDLGIIPFNNSYTNISLFNFYDLDNNSPESNPITLQQQLVQRDYIILPSQRIIKPRLFNKEQFPFGNDFYTNLTNGSLGYQKIYETPCDIFCKITYLGDPVFRFEETANVFDRPTIIIFKKEKGWHAWGER